MFRVNASSYYSCISIAKGKEKKLLEHEYKNGTIGECRAMQLNRKRDASDR